MTSLSRMDANVPAPAQVQIVPPRPRPETTEGQVPPSEQVAAADKAARAELPASESTALRIEGERLRAARQAQLAEEEARRRENDARAKASSADVPIIPTRHGVRFDDEINRFVIEVRDAATDKVVAEIPNEDEQRRLRNVEAQIGRLLDDLA